MCILYTVCFTFVHFVFQLSIPMLLWTMGNNWLLLYALLGIMAFGLFPKLEAQDGKLSPAFLFVCLFVFWCKLPVMGEDMLILLCCRQYTSKNAKCFH